MRVFERFVWLGVGSVKAALPHPAYQPSYEGATQWVTRAVGRRFCRFSNKMSVSTVECITLDGHTKRVQSGHLFLRPAAYALIVQDGKLLLLKMRHTGKYHLPGGGIHLGERMEETLKRETKEETGIEIDVVQFTHFEEVFFYYDPSERAYHGLHFYFICKPKTLKLLPDDYIKDGSAEQPRWIEICELRAEDFQIHGDKILELCQHVAA